MFSSIVSALAHRPASGALGKVVRAGAGAALALALSGTAQAFPSLGLLPGTPDIEASFIDVSYVGNTTAGDLTASGFANVLSPPGSPAGNIAGGSFSLSASISELANTASGTLTIGGTIASQGFNSGTLLTGTLSAFGAGPGDPLEFLFDVTGGDAAGLFGPTAGVILSQSGFLGSFASGFSSAPFGALADTFGVPQQVSAPATLGLLLAGLLLTALRRTARTGPAMGPAPA